MRINKYLAACGLGSRRSVEELVRTGRVSIDGTAVKDLGTAVGDDSIVQVDGKVVTAVEQHFYVVLNKPRGYVTTCKDEKGRKTVMDLIKGTPFAKYVKPVGRLDCDTSGLLILTNDGEFAQRMTRPSFKVGKTYLATLDRAIDRLDVKRLCGGVEIDGEVTHPATAKVVAPTKVELTITQGRNRQVRKMFAALGYNVVELKRTAIGNLTLGSLRAGEFKLVSNPDKVIKGNAKKLGERD